MARALAFLSTFLLVAGPTGQPPPTAAAGAGCGGAARGSGASTG